jgi:DNA-binding MarR family transcriptional regulator
MSTNAPFTQLVGQLENAFGAVLDEQLVGTGLSKPQWVALTLVVMSGESIERRQLTTGVAGALKLSELRTDELIVQMVAAGWLADDGSAVSATDAGRELQTRVRTAVGEVTDRLWGDLPDDGVATTIAVLSTILERVNAELAPA